MESSDKKMIYIVVRQDHCDHTEVYPFSELSHAIEQAEALAKHFDEGGQYSEADCETGSGWVFYAKYSRKHDHVRVEEMELNKDIEQ